MTHCPNCRALHRITGHLISGIRSTLTLIDHETEHPAIPSKVLLVSVSERLRTVLDAAQKGRL
jgi:hypothetical protein